MRSLLRGIPVLVLLTAVLASVPTAASDAPEAASETIAYFNQRDGKLVLTELPPSAQNATRWTMTGYFGGSAPVTVKIPLANVRPDLEIDESVPPRGWIEYQVQAYTNSMSLFTYGAYGHMEWLLVEGERTSKMVPGPACGYDENYEYYSCDYENYDPFYTTDFPGHDGEGRAHTHGDGTDAARPLYAGDFGWALVFHIQPNCLILKCLVGSSGKYTISVLTDGSTFVKMATTGASLPEEVPVEEPTVPDDGNATEEETGNETTNETSSNETATNETATDGGGEDETQEENSSAEAAFAPQSYKATQAGGEAPGAPLWAFLAAVVGAGAYLRRRGGSCR